MDRRIGKKFLHPTRGARVFSKTRAALASDGETSSNPTVHTNGFGYVVNITSYTLTQIGNLVDERDLRRQKGVCSVFGQLSRFQRSDDEWRSIKYKGR